MSGRSLKTSQEEQMMYQGDGEIDTFLQFPFEEWEKRVNFARKVNHLIWMD
jgi:hypothetical protein